MHGIFMTIVMSAKKDKSGKRRQGPLQILVTGNIMVIVGFSVPIQAYMYMCI